jgi:hypothetical protein
MSDYASVCLIQASKRNDILAALQQGGKLEKYDRIRFVTISDSWIGYVTSDYYGANAKDLLRAPEYVRDISSVAPAITFAHGMDQPEFGLCLFADGECVTRFHYFSVEILKYELKKEAGECSRLQAECINNFDSAELRRVGVGDAAIGELGEAISEMRDAGDEEAWDGAYDLFKDILEFDFGKIDSDHASSYDPIDIDGD